MTARPPRPRADDGARSRGTLAAAVSVVTVVLTIGAEVAAQDGSPPPVAVDAADLPGPHADIADWAVSLFAEADLELPALRYVHHGDDRDPCRGWKAVHRHDAGVSEIGLCTIAVGPAVEWLILHETAHAWAAHSLTDERRDAFRNLRGWDEWRTGTWHESGSEQAAEILAWGLIDRPVGVVTINDHGCDDLAAGYRTLTGQEPLHGFRDHC